MEKASVITNGNVNIQNISVKSKEEFCCDFLHFAATNFIIEGAYEYREINSNKLITAKEIYNKFTE